MFSNSVSWFPQEQAHIFYAIKGILALVATLLLVFHMSQTWNTIERWGQRLRYISLLAFAVLVTSSTIEQLQQQSDVNYRNLGTMVCVLLLLLAMSVSIHDDVMGKPRRRHR